MTRLLVDVESESVVLVEGEALLDAVDQVRGGDEATAKDDGNFVVLVLFLDGLDGQLGSETTGDQDGVLATPRLQGKLEGLVLRITVDN